MNHPFLGDDPYDIAYKQRLDAIYPRLWDALDRVPALPAETQAALLREALEMACTAQNMRNITLGRETLWALPREWLLRNLETAAQSTLNLDDDWEYRRLLEVAWHMDLDLIRRLIQQGIQGDDSGVQATAQECLDCLAAHDLLHTHGPPGFEYWESPSE